MECCLPSSLCSSLTGAHQVLMSYLPNDRIAGCVWDERWTWGVGGSGGPHSPLSVCVSPSIFLSTYTSALGELSESISSGVTAWLAVCPCLSVCAWM